MKSFRYVSFFVFCFSLHYVASAQTTPEAFLSQLPPVPQMVCSADTSVVNRFTNQIYEVKSALQEIVDRIHAEAEANQAGSARKILAGAARQSNLSKKDMEQLQSEDADEAAALKAAEKMVGEQYNLSLQDMQKLGEMSDADQEKWAQNYAGNRMIQAKKNPASSVKKGDENARLFELAAEQKTIGERITQKMTQAAGLLKNVDLQDTIETRRLNEKLRPLEQQLCSGICSPAEVARSRAAEKQIYNLKVQYCEKMSPLLANAISQYLVCVKTVLPDYRKLADVQNEIARQQFGEITSGDLSCYAAVDEYADVLLQAYRYCVGKFEE